MPAVATPSAALCFLNEALPHLALKHSPRSFGARDFFEAINKRAILTEASEGSQP
jgi:hypothetical protein